MNSLRLVLLMGLAWAGASAALAQNASNQTATATATNKVSATSTNTAAAASKLTPEQRKAVAELLKGVKETFDAKKYAEAKDKLLELIKLQPDGVDHWYNLACAQSQLGQKKEAVQSLETAAEKGWCDFLHLERDTDLDPIRQEPGYKKLLARKDELQKARAKKIHEELLKQYGKDTLYHIDDQHRLIYATTVDQRTLDELRETLQSYAKALSAELFRHKGERYVTVVVPKTWNGGMIGGMYNDQNAALVSRGVGDEMIHEFTHALHHADQRGRDQKHPIWLTEGLGTLYEDSTIEEGRAVPRHNYRLNFIFNRIRVNRQMPFAKFMDQQQADFMRWPNYNYAQARYMMFYLHEQGKLGSWYQQYVTNYAQDTNGVSAWERTFSKPLTEIEKDWVSWMKTLTTAPLQLKEGDPNMGLALQPNAEGLLITAMSPESKAGPAGLKLKDLITRVDGSRVVSGIDLLDVLNRHKVGDKVAVEYRRAGQYQQTEVELTPTPSPYRAKQTKPKPAKPATAPDKAKPQDPPQPAAAATKPAS